MKLLDARPHLFVSDVTTSAKFFEQAFGFQIRDKMGDPPVHAILVGDGVTITVAAVKTPAARTGTAAFYIDVEDVQAFFDRCVEHGLQPSDLVDRPWGMRDFVVSDPDGHLIACGERVR